MEEGAVMANLVGTVVEMSWTPSEKLFRESLVRTTQSTAPTFSAS